MKSRFASIWALVVCMFLSVALVACGGENGADVTTASNGEPAAEATSEDDSAVETDGVSSAPSDADDASSEENVDADAGENEEEPKTASIFVGEWHAENAFLEGVDQAAARPDVIDVFRENVSLIVQSDGVIVFDAYGNMSMGTWEETTSTEASFTIDTPPSVNKTDPTWSDQMGIDEGGSLWFGSGDTVVVFTRA